MLPVLNNDLKKPGAIASGSLSFLGHVYLKTNLIYFLPALELNRFLYAAVGNID